MDVLDKVKVVEKMLYVMGMLKTEREKCHAFVKKAIQNTLLKNT